VSSQLFLKQSQKRGLGWRGCPASSLPVQVRYAARAADFSPVPVVQRNPPQQQQHTDDGEFGTAEDAARSPWYQR